MPLIVQRSELIRDGVRFEFREYDQSLFALELTPDADYVGVRSLKLYRDDQVVVAYNGCELRKSTMPSIMLRELHTQRDLVRSLDAAKGYTFHRLFTEQKAGSASLLTTESWNAVASSEYDRCVLYAGAASELKHRSHT